MTVLVIATGRLFLVQVVDQKNAQRAQSQLIHFKSCPQQTTFVSNFELFFLSAGRSVDLSYVYLCNCCMKGQRRLNTYEDFLILNLTLEGLFGKLIQTRLLSLMHGLALSRDPGKIGSGTGFQCGTEQGKGRDSILKSRNPETLGTSLQMLRPCMQQSSQS